MIVYDIEERFDVGMNIFKDVEKNFKTLYRLEALTIPFFFFEKNESEGKIRVWSMCSNFQDCITDRHTKLLKRFGWRHIRGSLWMLKK